MRFTEFFRMVSQRTRALRGRQFLFLYLGVAALFLFFLNRWLWPTPDEYLYASVARSLIVGLKGEICLGCLNTEHPYLVSSLVALYQWARGLSPLDLIASRVPIIFFSLGTIVILWLIAGRVVPRPRERSWLLWLLLLVPGYFILSTRLLLDVPLTFGFALLLYLLLIRARPIWVGMSLLVLLLTKSYGVFLATPLVLGAYFFEMITDSTSGWGRSLLELSRKLLAAFTPSLLAIALILGLEFLPYPRLTEANLIQYFGDGYALFAKGVLTLVQKVVIAFAPPEVAQQVGRDIADKIGQISLTGRFPTALFGSPLEPEAQGGFFTKLWLIYRYNFSEQDVSVFLLPLFVTGLVVRMRRLRTLGARWIRERADLLFFPFVLIFIYVNWHEALNIHGFRLTVPITLALVYFGYWGARAVLVEKNRWARRFFGAAFLVSMALYAAFVLQLGSYGSVIASHALVGLLLQYKLVIFGAAFLAAFAFIWHYHRLDWPFKQTILALGILGFFAVKLLPFYFESKAATATFEYDYGLPKTSPLLRDIRTDEAGIATNINPYTMDYYSLNLKLPNEGSAPVMRKFREHYPQPYYWYRLPTHPLTTHLLYAQNVRYIFFVNRELGNDSLEEFLTMLESLRVPLTLVAREHHPETGRLQWEIYAVDLE